MPAERGRGPIRLSATADALINDFARQPGVSGEQRDQLRMIIGSSPALARQLDVAAAHGDLRRIRPLPEASSAGAMYEPSSRTIQLRLSRLTPATLDETTFVLGHEVQHALNRREVQAADVDFFRKIDRTARRDQNYTPALADVLSAHRRDESVANLAGWNALADSLETRYGYASPELISARLPARAYDFVRRSPDTGELQPQAGLVIGSEGRIESTPSNVEAMARMYVDRPPRAAGLGRHGNSDYANHYGAWAVGVAAQIHVAHHPDPNTRPPMRADLDALRLSHGLMEQNGVDLGTPGDHGRRGQPVALVDGSKQPATTQLLHHTAARHRGSSAIADHRTSNPQQQAAQLARLGFTRRPQRQNRSNRSAPTTQPPASHPGRTQPNPGHGRES